MLLKNGKVWVQYQKGKQQEELLKLVDKDLLSVRAKVNVTLTPAPVKNTVGFVIHTVTKEIIIALIMTKSSYTADIIAIRTCIYTISSSVTFRGR